MRNVAISSSRPTRTAEPPGLATGGLAIEGLAIGGLVPFSTVDFPGRLAAVVFTQGCPLRCRYCHNPHLRGRAVSPSRQTWADVAAWLARRQGLLDAVVFSGGEPTAQPGLPAALAAVRGLGFATGLHTAGTHPRRLAAALPWLDWVGLDIKAPFDRYATTTGRAASGARAREALALVLASGVAHDIRTTVHPDLLSAADLLGLATALRDAGARRWVLQTFRPTGCDDAELLARPAPPDLAALRPILSGLLPDIVIR